MTMQYSVKVEGLDKLIAAMKRSPQLVLQEVAVFLQRGGAKIRSTVQNKPWMLNSGGGGAPVDTQAMRDSHHTKYTDFAFEYGPNMAIAPYANWVHEGTRKMKARPWLQYALESNENDINALAQDMIDNVVKGLAK